MRPCTGSYNRHEADLDSSPDPPQIIIDSDKVGKTALVCGVFHIKVLILRRS